MLDKTATRNLSVVIYAKNVVVGRGLEAVLQMLPQVEAIQHCASRREAEQALASGEIDVLVVTSVADTDVAELSGSRRDTRVLLLLEDVEASGAGLAGAMTADGFLIQQDLTPDHLGEALDRVITGEMPMPARVGRELLARAGSPAPTASSRSAMLTPRENETLALLADGLSNKQIARRLSISDHGAKRLVTSVMLKLSAPNRTAAVVIAIKQGLIAAN